jgi:hypothetical protein
VSRKPCEYGPQLPAHVSCGALCPQFPHCLIPVSPDRARLVVERCRQAARDRITAEITLATLVELGELLGVDAWPNLTKLVSLSLKIE